MFALCQTENSEKPELKGREPLDRQELVKNLAVVAVVLTIGVYYISEVGVAGWVQTTWDWARNFATSVFDHLVGGSAPDVQNAPYGVVDGVGSGVDLDQGGIPLTNGEATDLS